MSVSALRYLHTPTNTEHAVRVASLHEAREVVSVLDQQKVEGIRISYFSDYHHCEVITHQFTDGEFITTRKRM